MPRASCYEEATSCKLHQILLYMLIQNLKVHNLQQATLEELSFTNGYTELNIKNVSGIKKSHNRISVSQSFADSTRKSTR